MQDKKILLIEDNPDDIELTIRAFGRCEYSDKINLDIVTDGVEALNYFYKAKSGDEDGKPYLILLDLNLPRVNGFQILKKIKNDDKLRFIPLVVLTSSTEEGDLIKSYSLGANGYIQKPIDFNEFIEVIRKIGEYWVELNEHPT